MTTIWDRLEECVRQLDEPFRRSEIIGWFRRHHPDVHEASLGAHIQGATANTGGRGAFTAREPLIERLDRGLYRRVGGNREPQPATPPGATTSVAGSPDVVLVGCVKSKRDKPSVAKDLYTSELFRRRRAYAEASGAPWYVLSAEHGLVTPDSLLEPYDRELARQSVRYREAWGAWAAARLEDALGDLSGKTAEVHAGEAYAGAIREPLRRLGARVNEPLHGLTFGRHLSWYDEQAGARAAAHSAPPGGPARHRGRTDVIDEPHEIQPFAYRWPDAVEEFVGGWETVVLDRSGRPRRVRHGTGSRQVYGRHRAHSVTFLDGEPIVEGVAADDHADTRELVSALKGSDKHLIRTVDAIPAAYAGLPLTDHRTAVKVKYSRDAVAVRLAEDDVLGWAAYALAREEVWSTERGEVIASPTPSMPVATIATSTQPVVDALLKLGESEQVRPGEEPSFTPVAAANRLVIDDPFAFLLAVIFDQGIVAERAWRAPYDLMQRLGHLDPARMAAQSAAVRVAINQQPKLHRFVERVPEWVVEAARIVVEQYDGDASRIWADHPSAAVLRRRLDAFPGIGQKKAAMAVEILERDLGVAVSDMQGSDIAFDVHVRRVFLRTGLAELDDLDHMVDVARRANPDRPGAIDAPAWSVGRRWCHAGVPDCPGCTLAQVCPKLVGRAAGVTGA